VIASVDTDALLRLMWAGPLAVVVLTIAWGLVIRGTTLAIEARRDGRSVVATWHAVVALIGLAAFAAAHVFGLLIMMSKD
jgi:hypothetical protein